MTMPVVVVMLFTWSFLIDLDPFSSSFFFWSNNKSTTPQCHYQNKLYRMEDIHKQTNWQTMVSMMTEAKMKKQKKNRKEFVVNVKFTRQLASSQKKKESHFVTFLKISTLFEKFCFCVKMKKKQFTILKPGWWKVSINKITQTRNLVQKKSMRFN